MWPERANDLLALEIKVLQRGWFSGRNLAANSERIFQSNCQPQQISRHRPHLA